MESSIHKMEGKCNKAPNNNKYLDHVYCHTTHAKSVYSNNMTTAGGGSGGSNPNTPNADVLALLKENKQLKGMLILHLDLIQEQSDQLMALRARNTALENTILELQNQLQKQIKRSGEVSTLPPPPLAKIQCKSTNVANVPAFNQSANTNNTTSPNSQGVSNIIGVCNGKIINKIVLQRVSSGRGKQRTQSPQSQTTDTEDEDDEHEQYDEVDVEEVIEDDEDVVIHGLEDEEIEEDHEVVDKSQSDNSNAQPHIIDDLYDTGNSTEDSNEVLAVQSKRLRMKQAAKQSLAALPRGAKPSVSPASTTTNDGQTTFKAVTTANTSHLSVSRGKQMTIMRWHAPDYHTDESYDDSNAETEKVGQGRITYSLLPFLRIRFNNICLDFLAFHICCLLFST